MSKLIKHKPYPLHGMESMYNFYVDSQKARNEPHVSYLKFTETIRRFNNKLVDTILDGMTFYPGHQLGEIRIVRMRRNFERPTIDWGETDKLTAKQGFVSFVYYQDEYYYRWYWRKYKCMIQNRSVYAFQPAQGPKGATKRLSWKLKREEFSHLNYKTRAKLDEHDQ